MLYTNVKKNSCYNIIDFRFFFLIIIYIKGTKNKCAHAFKYTPLSMNQHQRTASMASGGRCESICLLNTHFCQFFLPHILGTT